MATRLYPNTQNPAVLEKLAGVPAGTHAALTAAKADFFAKKAAVNNAFAALSVEDREGELGLSLRRDWSRLDSQEWEAINSNEDMAELDHFLVFGWGRVNPEILDTLGYDTVAGETTNLNHVLEIAATHNVTFWGPSGGVKLEELEGLHWS